MVLVLVGPWSEKEGLEQFKHGLWSHTELARLGVSRRATILGYGLTCPSDAQVLTGFELVTKS